MAEINQAMNAAFWFMVIYLHLLIGLVVGLVLLWRVKTRRRWWGALLAYLCLLLIFTLPFMGRLEAQNCIMVSDEYGSSQTCEPVVGF